MNKNIIIESEDLEEFNDDENTQISDIDLEEIIDDNNKMDDIDYQYILKIKEGEKKNENDLEPQFTFVLIPKDEEELENEEDLERMENKGEEIKSEESPKTSNPTNSPSAFPMESKKTENIIKEDAPISQETEPVPTTPPKDMSPEALEPLETTDEEELEVIGNEFEEQEFKDFINNCEMNIKFFIDDKTEFSVNEITDYLKLYPDNEIFVKVDDLEKFQEKLDEHYGENEELENEVENEKQKVMVDKGGKNIDVNGGETQSVEKDAAKTAFESFSLYKFNGEKKIPNGNYIGNIKESKLYGIFDDIKISGNKLLLDKDEFIIENSNISLNLEQKIDIILNEENSKKLNKYLQEKTEITIKL